MQFMLVMSIFGVLTTTAFVANSVHRDFELGTDSLFFSSPIKKWQYLFGRFSGSFIVATLVYLGVAVAIMIGSLMPWIEKERLGPFDSGPTSSRCSCWSCRTCCCSARSSSPWRR
jgi:ABC-2 type transport system permease protein